MAYTTINDPSAHFHTHLYTGNNSNRSETNDANAGDFQPDWVWIKARSEVKAGRIFDSTRGATKVIYPSATNAEGTTATSLTSFDSDGFSLGNSDGINKNTITYVAWQWKANGGTTASNTDGSITSTVQANTTAGFSIITYTGTGSNATIGHGLGATPSFIIFKERDANDNWSVFHTSVGNTGKLRLNGTNATITASTIFNDTSPTSSVYTTGTDGELNGSMVAYCFTEIQGYSKFGSYEGNGNADGTFVYLGFKPAFVMIKNADGSGDEWVMLTGKIATGTNSNPLTDALYANSTGAETGVFTTDFLSNGFKLRHTSGATSTSGETYTYMAFAEHPFVSSEGVPTTAR